jgi:hypothetical protein
MVHRPGTLSSSGRPHRFPFLVGEDGDEAVIARVEIDRRLPLRANDLDADEVSRRTAASASTLQPGPFLRGLGW